MLEQCHHAVTSSRMLEDGVDPQSILQAVVGKISVRMFDLREPSLHEIFVNAVGGKSDE